MADSQSHAGPATTAQSQDNPPAQAPSTAKRKRKNKHKKRRARRQSFAAPADHSDSHDMEQERPGLLDVPSRSANRSSFYRLNRGKGSTTSLDSNALLDHRDHNLMPQRRQSLHQSSYSNRSAPLARSRPSQTNVARHDSSDEDANDTTPLMGTSRTSAGYGGLMGAFGVGRKSRRSSPSSSTSSRRRRDRQPAIDEETGYHVNNPPSVPNSPRLGGSDNGYNDVMLDTNRLSGSPETRRSGPMSRDRDAIIDMADAAAALGDRYDDRSISPRRRRNTITVAALDDVCLPQEGLSEFGDEEYDRDDRDTRGKDYGPTRTRRRRPRNWPDLSVLEDWSHEEKEQRTMEGIRARQISEPLLVNGRLRPKKQAWHREIEEVPYRFTYFNEEFESTIHSQTISELLQDGQSFRHLFRPDPPELSDSSSDEEDANTLIGPLNGNGSLRNQARSVAGSRQSSLIRQPSVQPSIADSNPKSSEPASATDTPSKPRSQSDTPRQPKAKRYGPRPVFWLDVLQPTDAEMKVISKAFGLHPLTAEDIMLQEAREKVELFGHYYFLNYRTFEQDTNSEDYLEPVNFYAAVFREGVISFHFSQTPHPANVRRRIRQLSDYLILSSDWISYAIIDDITDVYGPLIERIEDEVDDIDEKILRLHDPDEELEEEEKLDEKRAEGGAATTSELAGDMLRRVGQCRKKVMSLYRLLGNKADVIKGFAKRCNEQWEVAPRSEIGMYLGDIQDHIVTMTGNLTHYENLLSRAHSNYLAQINIRMNERSEETNDVLGKLTVLGTIVLPMNIVTGMWGMNVMVPGQNQEGLTWFWSITASLLVFGILSYLIAKRVYGIV